MEDKIKLEEELRAGKRKTAKPMLIISLASMVMLFAGLTSAYVVSSKRSDWVDIALPNAFLISTLVIIASSIAFILGIFSFKREKRKLAGIFLISTLLLGISFIFFQAQGFQQLFESGYVFAGKDSTIKSSYVNGIALIHLLHVIAGIIVLFVVVFKFLTKRYTLTNYLGIQLGAIFWHFLGALWIYLYLFFNFIR